MTRSVRIGMLSVALLCWIQFALFMVGAHWQKTANARQSPPWYVRWDDWVTGFMP